MEIREFALRILNSTELEDKLTHPTVTLTDNAPRPTGTSAPPLPDAPARPPGLEIVSEVRVPSILGMPDPKQRCRILHAFANHELQATELFAWALLAFPEAPTEFRQGLVAILVDEQRHTRMYVRRLERLGAAFGDFPVTGYFWNHSREIRTPLEFICAMSLTFENANLDLTLDYAQAARDCGDSVTAGLIEQVHRDEAEHVRFGWHWLNQWTETNSTPWDTYAAALHWPLRPARARGVTFHRSGRERAGLDGDFIDRLASTEPAPPFAKPPREEDSDTVCRDSS